MTIIKRIGLGSAVTALALTLSACLLTPGKFVSALDLRKDGNFTFTYKGEISLYGVAQLAAMGKADETFKPSPCHDFAEPASDAAAAEAEATPGEETDPAQSAAVAEPMERACTAEELAEQKANWETSRKESAERQKREAEQMKAVLGGLDPTDPKSIEEFAGRLRRQAGWKQVAYKGNGLFEVDYAIAGKADHDFVFPIIEKFPTTVTFVQVLRRADDTVRIDAPGFNVLSANNPMTQMMGIGALGTMDKNDMPSPTEMDGTFTLTTDGLVLANNTEEGPAADSAGQRLTWTINVRTNAAPTALVKLAQ